MSKLYEYVGKLHRPARQFLLVPFHRAGVPVGTRVPHDPYRLVDQYALLAPAQCPDTEYRRNCCSSRRSVRSLGKGVGCAYRRFVHRCKLAGGAQPLRRRSVPLPLLSGALRGKPCRSAARASLVAWPAPAQRARPRRR